MIQGSAEGGDGPLVIYTIGHSNHALATFLELLRQHGIRCLVDVRSQPYSRYVTHFNRPELEDAVERQGIRYRFLGEELGGRPSDEYYDPDDHVDYLKVARQSTPFASGIARLLEEAAQHPTAMMCSEEDPRGCHRHRLIGHALVDPEVSPRFVDRALAERGVAVRHIRADGRVQTESDLRPPPPPTAQQSLWGADVVESPDAVDPEWRSVRPIPRRRAQPGSSDDADE